MSDRTGAWSSSSGGASRRPVARRPSPFRGGMKQHARLYRRPPRLDRARDGHRRGVRVPAAASLARRSGRDHRRRQRDRRADRRDPPPARARRCAAGAVLPLGDRRAAGRPRHLDLLQRAGRQADQPAHRADALARAHHAHGRGHARGLVRRARGLEGRHLDRPRADGRVGDRLLGAGVRRRLHADLRVLDQPALAAGAGLFADRAGLGPVDRAADPALDRARACLRGADRAHHPHLDARSARRGLHPHRARERRREPLDAAEACLEERRRADRHRDRHRRRAADRRRRHHRDRVQHSRASGASWSMRSPSATTRSSRA